MAFFAGFDTKGFPGADMMTWLHGNTNLSWCGYYLAPAPNRPPSGWQNQYTVLKDQWGVLPIYVGQQDPTTGTPSHRPSSILTADQGTTDGRNAADLAVADQFPRGTFVFLDWESGGLGTAGAEDYITAWIAAVATDGRVMPAVYCSHGIADRFAALIDKINPTPVVRFWCWKVTSTAPHPFAGDLTSIPTIDPAGCGFQGADAWQREQRAVVIFPDGAPVGSLEVDFSTSSTANPAMPLTLVS